MNRSGDNLVVEVKEEGWFNGDNCKVNFEIKVPKIIALNLKSGFGKFEINGTKGKINFKLGSGDVVVDAEVVELRGKSGSGSVKVTGLVGDTYLKTGSGDITLSYKAVIQKGQLNIATGLGDATVSFPASMKIMTNFKSGSGQIYNELGASSDAAFKVSMKAGSGDLKIKKLK